MRRGETELCVSIPSFFRCPISMDVMKSPVSLCTGVTYDRTSIQKWLSQGHNTCPATMQVLPSTDITPNLTLRNIIHIWLSDLPPPSISRPQALRIIQTLSSPKDNLDSLNKIAHFLRFSKENREFIGASKAAVMEIVNLMESVGELGVCETVVMILDLILSVDGAKYVVNELIFQENRDILSRFVLVLQKGSLDSRMMAARVCELIAINSQSQQKLAETGGFLNELCNLIATENSRNAVEAGLSSISAISTTRPAKYELRRLGMVGTVSKILSKFDSIPDNVLVIEKAMKVLEMVATCTEGRAEIDEECAVEIMNKLMKCSSRTRAHGITVLWSVCCLGRGKRVKERVNRANGLTKILLVMQSDCSANVRQMCCDLVKALSVNNGNSCLASYQTRTTHITPY